MGTERESRSVLTVTEIGGALITTFDQHGSCDVGICAESRITESCESSVPPTMRSQLE
jgi:hypothetical protein